MWPGAEPGLALLVTAVAAWLWGSFLNQLIDRTPYRTQAGADAGVGAHPGTEWQPRRPPGPPPGVTLLRPRRSLCFACGQRIPWLHNIPIASYLWLRGRCRACGAPIGGRTLVVEVATPLALTGWNALWMALDAAPAALLVWGLGAGSALIVAAGLVAERRRRPLWLWALAAGLLLLAPSVLAR